jgi:hypothetical protein
VPCRIFATRGAIRYLCPSDQKHNKVVTLSYFFFAWHPAVRKLDKVVYLSYYCVFAYRLAERKYHKVIIWSRILKNILQTWSPNWDVSRTTFGSLPRRSRSQHDLAAKSCPAHYFVIWSRIWQLFLRNDHHIKTTYRATFGCFYTLNFVCDITLTIQEVYLPVSRTYSGSITRFNRLLFALGSVYPTHVSRPERQRKALV